MSQSPFVPLVVIAAVGGAGWFYRQPIMDYINPPPPPKTVSASSHPEPHKDTVYKWVDKDGVVHFDQQNGEGKKAVEIDQSRIQSMARFGGPAPASGAGANPGTGGQGSATSRSRENHNRAEDHFQQTRQDYVP